MNGMTSAIRWRRRFATIALVLLGAVGGLLPQAAHANSVKDALNLAATFAPVVDTYIAPASLAWLPSLYDALSKDECTSLSSDIDVANCASALLESDAGGALGEDKAAIAEVLGIYVDVRGSDWGELFSDVFRLAAAGDPLDVACKILTLAVGGFPVCGVLELLYDVAKFALQAAEAIVEAFAVNDWGESEAMDLVAYFNQYFLPKVDIYARGAQNHWQAMWDKAGAELIEPCKHYLTDHRNAGDTAGLRCFNGMFKGEKAGVETRFIDKGFLQMTSARYAMLELPRVVNDRFASMAKADSFNTGAPGLRTRLLGVWGLDASGKTVLDANGIGAWPNGSIGAVAMARMRLYVAHYGDGEPVMKQKLQEAVDYALTNTPAWKTWQQLGDIAANVPCKQSDDGYSFVCPSFEKLRACLTQYAKPLSGLPRAAGPATRAPPPACRLADTGNANLIALMDVNKALRAEFNLYECEYDTRTHPTFIRCKPGSESARKCDELLKSRYGAMGLPNNGASCNSLAQNLPPPTGGVTISHGNASPNLPSLRPVVPQPEAAATPTPRTRIDPRRRNGTFVAPTSQPPLCTPTAERGVMQCPTQESIPGCERARRLGQVRQCLPPSR